MTRMHSRLVLSVLVLSLFSNHLIAQAAAPERQQTSQQPSQDQQEPEQPARVVGEAREKAEFDAWQVVERAGSLSEKAELAARFLESFPNSGLTAFAHHVLADAAYQVNDVDNFILHAEQALLELPEVPQLLAPLAYLYSERRQTAKASDYANRALLLLEKSEKPVKMTSSEWVNQRQGLQADSHYALGRAHLELWQQSVGSPEELRQAVEHFSKTLELDPEHAYAAFRLGFAQGNSRNPKAAVAALARASILDSPAAERSRTYLERIHSMLQNARDYEWAGKSIEDILEEAKRRLAAEQAEEEQELARLAEEIDNLVKEGVTLRSND